MKQLLAVDMHCHPAVSAIKREMSKLFAENTDDTGELTPSGEFWAYDSNNGDLLSRLCPWVDVDSLTWDEVTDVGACAWDIAFDVPMPPPPPPKQRMLDLGL